MQENGGSISIFISNYLGIYLGIAYVKAILQ